MPRPNPPRTLQSEQNLARRIAHERERRGWTYEGTAKRLTDAGCPIQSTAIYKIEKSAPPRRISVDELVGFATVFDIPVEQLLMPLELVQSEALQALFVDWWDARRVAEEAKAAEDQALANIRQHVEERADLEEHLRRFVRLWMEGWEKVPDPDFGEAYWMHHLTGDEAWEQRLWDLFEAARPTKTKKGRK